MPTTINPSGQTITQYNVQTGGANNLLNNVAPASQSGTPLCSAGASSQPTFNAYPQVSGLGVGASPGSTAGLTFDGSNFMNNYVAISSFTPALNLGGSTTGITYTSQLGRYIRIGGLVFFHIQMLLSSKGVQTGNATITGMPVASSSSSITPLQYFVMYSSIIAANNNPNWYIGGSSSTLTLLYSSPQVAGGQNNITDSLLTNISSISIAGFYFV